MAFRGHTVGDHRSFRSRPQSRIRFGAMSVNRNTFLRLLGYCSRCAIWVCPLGDEAAVSHRNSCEDCRDHHWKAPSQGCSCSKMAVMLLCHYPPTCCCSGSTMSLLACATNNQYLSANCILFFFTFSPFDYQQQSPTN